MMTRSKRAKHVSKEKLVRPELRTPKDTQALEQPASAERPGAQKSSPQSSETWTGLAQGVPLNLDKMGESPANPPQKLASKVRYHQLPNLLETRRLARRMMMQGRNASQLGPQVELEDTSSEAHSAITTSDEFSVQDLKSRDDTLLNQPTSAESPAVENSLSPSETMDRVKYLPEYMPVHDRVDDIDESSRNAPSLRSILALLGGDQHSRSSSPSLMDQGTAASQLRAQVEVQDSKCSSRPVYEPPDSIGLGTQISERKSGHAILAQMYESSQDQGGDQRVLVGSGINSPFRYGMPSDGESDGGFNDACNAVDDSQDLVQYLRSRQKYWLDKGQKRRETSIARGTK